ncbi:hypothetical protein HW556_18255, partial [Hymenobacter sp. P5252]|nr:hypothetical protein [Hymenobacter terrestris]
MLGETYLREGNFAAALRAVDESLTASVVATGDTSRSQVVAALNDYAFGLVLKSAVLLAQGRVAEAGQVLPQAQHLRDSLRIPLNSTLGYFELDAAWARYYALRGQTQRAEQAWLHAYRQARELSTTPLRLAYLRELAGFYQARGQSAPAARYSLAAAALADTLERAQGAWHVAQYEVEQADRAQQARIATLRLAQVQDAARARRQRLVLGAVLAVLALIGGLVFVLWRGNRQQQRANALLNQLNAAVNTQKGALEIQRDQLNASLTELRTTQAQLIQKEKMASLGELTAGIAHEIQNPLNFVNNFSEVSSELLAELADEQARPERDAELEAELVDDLRQNMGKITQHGQRAASIVKGMLEHSQTRAGERLPTDVNRLCDESLRLAYQGLRAKDKSFSASLT